MATAKSENAKVDRYAYRQNDERSNINDVWGRDWPFSGLNSFSMVTLELVRGQGAIGNKDSENSLVSPEKRTLLDVQLTWETNSKLDGES